jgi:hypothetical protein
MLEIVKFRVNDCETRIIIFSGKIVALPSRYLYYLTSTKEIHFTKTRSLCLCLTNFYRRIAIRNNSNSLPELEYQFLNLTFNDTQSILQKDVKLTSAVHGFFRYCRKEEKIQFKFNEDDLLIHKSESNRS